MWSVPFNFNLRDSYYAIGLTHNKVSVRLPVFCNGFDFSGEISKLCVLVPPDVLRDQQRIQKKSNRWKNLKLSPTFITTSISRSKLDVLLSSDLGARVHGGEHLPLGSQHIRRPSQVTLSQCDNVTLSHLLINSPELNTGI